MNINFAFTVLELAHLSIATITASKKVKTLATFSKSFQNLHHFDSVCRSNITELIANDKKIYHRIKLL